ncbi:hypothetical protein K525DRAFT_158351, partial [Schizophyllum commune Loenen D]
MEPLFRCPICFESFPMAEMRFTAYYKTILSVKDASQPISKASNARAQQADRVPEDSSIEGEDPDPALCDGDQAGLGRRSMQSIFRRQQDERVALLAKAQRASEMRRNMRGSHGLSAGLLSSMPAVLAATPLSPEPELPADAQSTSVRSTPDTANRPDGHAPRRHCYCNGCVNTMQLRGRECPLCREYVRDVHPFPRFIEMDHSAYDDLKGRYDDLRGERYLLAVERNALKDASDVLRAE